MLGTKIQMQVSWEQVKMLDKSFKSTPFKSNNGYKCDATIIYDTCMYAAVRKVKFGSKLVIFCSQVFRENCLIIQRFIVLLFSPTNPWIRTILPEMLDF